MSFCNTNVWSIVFPEAYLRKLTIYSGRIANGIPVQKGGFGLAQSEQMMQAAGAEEGKDLEALQKAVAEKQQKAVEVILSELL